MKMDDLPYFLHRLSLGLDADAREIRRAYARELKLIDQEKDPAAFQALRESYEIGLRWAAHQAYEKEQQLQAPEEAPVESTDAATPDEQVYVAAAPFQPEPAAESFDPYLLAAQVFDRFSLAYKLLCSGRMINDVSLWQEELQRRLDDDELLNITARTHFEARIAHRLTEDWDAGQPALFAAAALVFDWNNDHRRLQQFGYAGAFLNQAIAERAMFETQNLGELTTQRKVLARLRADETPAGDQIKRDMYFIDKMNARFPRLMALMIDPKTIEQWREILANSKPPAPPRPVVEDNMPEPVLEGARQPGSFDKAWILFAIIAVITLFRFFGGADYSPPAYQGQTHADSTVDPRITGQTNRPIATGRPLDGEALQAIYDDLDYPMVANMPLGARRVTYDVLLDDQGNVLGMNKLRKSIDIKFDQAVEAAIRRSKPFPASAGIRTAVHIGMNVYLKPSAKKSRQPGAPERFDLSVPPPKDYLKVPEPVAPWAPSKADPQHRELELATPKDDKAGAPPDAPPRE